MLEKKEAKRIRAIQVASSQMNAQGATSVSLASVAKSMGVTRNALYYYFKKQQDLIYACYLHASKATEADLDKALAENASVLEKLRSYIKLTLLGDNAERAILCDLDALSDVRKKHIQKINQSNLERLKSLISDGIENQELRAVEPDIAARMLQSLLNWSQLWHIWVVLNKKNIKRRYETAVGGIMDNFFYGFSSDIGPAFNCLHDVELLMSRKVNVFDSKNLHAEKRFQLVGTASLLFNRRGIDGVSMDDIAAHLGTTDGAVYYYFKDKASIVTACIEQSLDQYEKIIQFADGCNLSELHKILMVAHLNCQIQTLDFPPLVFQGSIAQFSTDYIKRIDKNISGKMNKIRLAAIKQGLHKPSNRYSLEISAGQFHWISNWHQDQSSITKNQLGDEVCRILASGIVHSGR